MSEEAAAADAKSTKTTKTTKPEAKPKLEEEEEAGPVVEEEGGWKEFIWNSEKHEFLGRTGKSWLDITFFYIIFFASLYFFVMCSWYLSLLVISENEPYQHRVKGEKVGLGAILYRKGPGLTFRPVPDRIDNGISSLIWIRTGTPEEHKFWSSQLRDWMKKVPDADKAKYGECDGKDTDYGYDKGQPCILLKLNRIFNWEPDTFTVAEMKEKKVKVKAYTEESDDDRVEVPVPPGLHKALAKASPPEKAVWVYCEGDNGHDAQTIGAMEYYPGPWIEKTDKNFPYKMQDGYQTPFIMLKIKRPLVGALLSFECYAFAKNIKLNPELGIGHTKFQILVGG